MNPAQLLSHFDRISEAPAAIPRLRRFILDLAVRGKLIEQDPRDEPASELLKWIQEEKARLVKIGEIKKLETFEPVEVDEIPFTIPLGWEVIRMGWLARKLGAGSTPLGGKSVYQSAGVPFLRSQNVHDDGLRLDDVALISRSLHERMSGTHVQRNDILLNITGASIGRCALVPSNFAEGNVSQHVAIIRLVLSDIRQFIHLSLTSPFFQKVIDDVQVGVSREGLSMQRLRPFPMLIPPLAEQHRIVAKVDELMALCDRLEATQAERESRRDRLVTSSLNRLNNKVDPDTFRNHARFYFNHLPRLTTRHEHVKKLRGAILNLAFRGRLTSPWRETAEFVGTAQEFKLSVENARKKAWDNKQVASSSRKYLFPVEFDRENLPTIPDSWVWASADAVCSQITDGEHIQPRYQLEGLPMLTAKHVREGFVTFEDSELISESDFKKCIARCKPEEGDILVVSVGATTGRAAIVSQSRPFALVRSVLLLKPLISPVYFLRWLQSPWCFVWMRQASEASAQPHLYIGDTRRMPVPLPPLAEQQRIVAKVDELMALCDRLEAQLTTTQTESRRLLEAVLHEALSLRSKSEQGVVMCGGR